MKSSALKIKNKTVVFTGGGTGGHLWPIVSLVHFARHELGVDAVYFGTGTDLEKRVWKKERVRQIIIPSGKKRSYFSLLNFLDPFLLAFGFIKAFFWLLIYRPALVFGKGGYGMLPTVMAARILGINIVVHESDIVIGRANRKALDWGALVLTAFPSDTFDVPDPQKSRLRYCGQIIHPYFYENDDNDKGREKTILVFGGSQGSEKINQLVSSLWVELTAIANVIHITGPQNINHYRQAFVRLKAEVRSKLVLLGEDDDLPQHIKKASLVICRAGSTSLWEVAYTGTPTIAVPLPLATGDHQKLNALWMSQEFPFISFLEEKGLSSEKLYNAVKNKITKSANAKPSPTIIMPNMALKQVGNFLQDALKQHYFAGKKTFHLVGSEGVSMRGIAKVLQAMGHNVSGSDVSRTGHSKANITKNIDAVIYSSAAVASGAPGLVEVNRARALSIPTIKRSAFIADLVSTKKLITVSGMHGKSTTTAMIAHILKELGLDPTYFIGVPQDGIGNNVAFLGRGSVAVIEACEYDRSFYDFRSDIIALTNIEKEHLDYFKGGIKEIEEAFAEYICRSRTSATLVFDAQNSYEKKVLEKISKTRADIRVVKPTLPLGLEKNNYSFFGDYNFSNANLATSAVAQLGIMPKEAWRALLTFKGAKRRMELVGEVGGARIYDDYGHHPTEIKMALDALKKHYPKHRLTVVFQPHQAKRTEDFFQDFVSVLALADRVIITDIFKVQGRDKESKLTSVDLVNKINAKKKGKAFYLPLPYENITHYLQSYKKEQEVVVTMGATDIYKVAYRLVGKE